MSFRKLKIFIAVSIILFLIISAEIIVFGFLSQPKDLQAQNITVINESVIITNKKNVTPVNVVDNSTLVTVPVQTRPIPGPITRAS